MDKTIGEAVGYVVLDSFQKNSKSDMSAGIISWDITTYTSLGKYITVADEIDNIIEFRLLPFVMAMPKEEPYDLKTTSYYVTEQNNSSTTTILPLLPIREYPMYRYAPWVYNPLSQVPYGGRFTIYIYEFARQAFAPLTEDSYQFEFALTPMPYNMQFIEAKPVNKKFIFSSLVSHIQTITLLFKTLTHNMRFNQDVYSAIIIDTDTAGYVRFKIPDHDLYHGDRIVITNFTCGINEIDAMITNSGGLLVAIDPTNLNKPPHGTPIPGSYFWTDPAIKPFSPFSTTCTVYVLKRRIRIPCELRQVRYKKTNYKTIV